MLTQKFPFESGEEFLGTELDQLILGFDEVILIPTAVRDFSTPRPTAENVKVRIVKNPTTPTQILGSLASNFFDFFRVLQQETKGSRRILKSLKYYIYHIPYALTLRSVISEELAQQADYVCYSYWMDTNALAFSLLKRQNPGMKFIVKSHGGDLYNERNPNKMIPFRIQVYGQADSLLFISRHGQEYAENHYPEFAQKMKVFRLGVNPPLSVASSDLRTNFRVVSVSSLVPIKRVKLIAEVLNAVNLPIEWIHFGGESSAIESLQLEFGEIRKELSIEWKGKVSNSEIQKYYSENFVDAFVNLSSSEGIPVSMMEAISNGIPIFSNAVGGIPEIVNESTGVLVDPELSVEKIASEFERFLGSGICKTESFRTGIRSFWKANFSAEKRHRELITHLKQFEFSTGMKRT